MKKLAQGFNTVAQDSNPGSLSRESEALPLSHCALLKRFITMFTIIAVQLNYASNPSRPIEIGHCGMILGPKFHNVTLSVLNFNSRLSITPTLSNFDL